MAQRVSGKRYGQAIFELAQDQGAVEQWGQDMALVAQAFEDAEFGALLKHAGVSAEDKRRATEAVLGDIRPLVRNMVDLLVARGLVDAVLEACREYTEWQDRLEGRQRVEVTTAVPLGPEEVERITNFVAELIGREVVVTPRVDEEILGGLVIQIGDRLLDGSARARLNGLRERLNAGIR
ncbi:ATP synthase subunit delta [Geodia barretti]|uniref:ATP synthase peripheral stalk subunit OSCP, mitochondrial n=1 Tax=Geodia barretti TaxID=519541 RepID=A0AA35TQ02_GEOBA|nr:ATP synthase subunit delta [Geodia barretti]